ncbi:hypothetical protein ABIB94_006826 [Bradyrhizobium sp. JR7.2]|uniref:hypothetical protein n=1 Tax=unclassified Bradyrhizobium TaxID=2631580 RepID=UPI003391649F
MMRSEKEWQRLDSSYCHGIVVPPLETIDDYINAIICSDPGLIGCILIKARQHPPMLIALFRALAAIPSPAMECRVAFHSAAWVTQGLHLREIFEIDELLPAALANMLPGYTGPPMELFRGERLSNHRLRAYGPAWSSDRSIGEMFASGVNCEAGGGGVLLRTIVQPSAILVGPEYGHQRWESEYIVDRRALGAVEVIATFPG